MREGQAINKAWEDAMKEDVVQRCSFCGGSGYTRYPSFSGDQGVMCTCNPFHISNVSENVRKQIHQATGFRDEYLGTFSTEDQD